MKTFRTLLVELKQLPAEMGYILGWAGDILAALIFVGTVILYVGASNEPLLALGGFIVAIIRPVVAYLRIGEHYDLARIRRIREDFLIARDGGIEYHLTRPLDGRTKTTALEDRAVFQGEDC